MPVKPRHGRRGAKLEKERLGLFNEQQEETQLQKEREEEVRAKR